MVNKEKYIGLGIDQDTAPDKRKPDTYWDAENIYIVNNGRSLSIKPILGETSIAALTAVTWAGTVVSGENRTILGYTVFNERIYVFSHAEALIHPAIGADYIQSVDEIFVIYKTSIGTHVITKLCYGDYDFSVTYPIDAVGNYETEDLIKIYWVDGLNPLRFINVQATTPTLYNIVNSVTLTKPTAVVSGSGNLIAGSIQYVYNMYNYNGIQSVLSPASELVSVASFFKGYGSAENTGLGMVITATLDITYQAVRLYSIHYLELNQTPQIKLIYEGAINNNSALSVFDDGLSFVAEYSVQDLLNISPLPYIPNTLAIKRDRLFIGNYTLSNFNPTIDTRAYSYPINSTSTYITDGGVTTLCTKATLDSLAATNDAINPDYWTYSYMYDSSERGGSGVNVNYRFVVTELSEPITTLPPKSLKRREIYRIGIMFYNRYGQKSPVKWIADTLVPSYDYMYSIGIKISLTAAGVVTLLAAGATAYQLCIVERKVQDRTILSQGFVIPSLKYVYDVGGDTYDYTPYWYPYYTPKHIMCSTIAATAGDCMYDNYKNDVDWSTDTALPYPLRDLTTCFFYSTDTVFETNSALPTQIRILGESIGYSNLTDTSLKLYQDNSEAYEEIIASSEPIWGVRATMPPFPYHILDQTPVLLSSTTNVYQYEVTRTFHYTSTYLNTFSTATTLVADVSTTQPPVWINSGELKSLGSSKIISNAASFASLINVDTSKLATSYYSTYANSIVLCFDSSLWHNGFGMEEFHLFDAADLYNESVVTAAYKRGMPLMELLQTVTNQYGGNTYEIKQSNEYLPLGNLRTIDVTENAEYIGDIWIGTLSVNRCDGGDVKYQGQMNIYEYINVDFIENNHNVYARQDNLYNYRDTLSVSTNYRYNRIADNHKLLGAYNQVPNVFKDYPVPFNFSAIEKYPLTIMGSNAKTANELLDNWLVFPSTNIKQLEGQYGPISKLHNLAGDLLALQSTGIALVEIEPRIQTTGTDGIGIYLGIGDLFYYHKYLATNTGTTNKFTVCDDGKNLYYYDNTLNLICTLHEGKLSTLKSVKAILDAYPTGPHRSTYFNKMDYVFFQYIGFTLVYDLLLQKFISKNSFLDSNKALIPVGQALYQLEESTGSIINFYTQLTGTVKASKIIYLMCPEADVEKVFHNLQYRLNGTDFTTVKVTNDISSSAVITPDTKIKFDIHRIHLPRVQNSRERFRGIYIFVELNNTGSYSLDDMILMYNIKG